MKLLKIFNLSLIVKFHHSSCRLLLLKNVTFENLIFQPQFKSDFLCFTEKSRSALIFNFSYFKPFHNLKSCDVMSISTHDRKHFWTYFLNSKSLHLKSWHTDGYDYEQHFLGTFCIIKGQGPKSRPFLFH